jgi:hypothetical protein
MLREGEIRNGDRAEHALWTPAQRAAIDAEANSVLAHPSFKSSRRCVTLFRCLIDYVLKGGHEGVKERTLGVEVFGRSPDYDTNADPIVRMTANEIRKRLAQYYQESPHHAGVKIRLVPGGYLPHFEFDGVERALPASEDDAGESNPGPIPIPFPPELLSDAIPPSNGFFARGNWMVWAAAGLLAVATVAASLEFRVFSSTQELIWAPLVESKEPVMICLADTNVRSAPAPTWAEQINEVISTRKLPRWEVDPGGMPTAPFVDATVGTMLSGWLGAHRKPFSTRQTTAITLDDLRRGPVMLIGAFDNPWALVLLSDLQYRVRVDPVTQDEWVEDTGNPSKRDWKGSGKLQFTDSSVDYAIVTRILDPETGKWILAAGGLGMHGTEAAGELLTDPSYSKILPSALRSTQKNFQLVLKTTVIDGHTGPPQVIAVHTW